MQKTETCSAIPVMSRARVTLVAKLRSAATLRSAMPNTKPVPTWLRPYSARLSQLAEAARRGEDTQLELEATVPALEGVVVNIRVIGVKHTLELLMSYVPAADRKAAGRNLFNSPHAVLILVDPVLRVLGLPSVTSPTGGMHTSISHGDIHEIKIKTSCQRVGA